MSDKEIKEFLLEGEEDFFIESSKLFDIEQEYRLAILPINLEK